MVTAFDVAAVKTGATSMPYSAAFAGATLTGATGKTISISRLSNITANAAATESKSNLDAVASVVAMVFSSPVETDVACLLTWQEASVIVNVRERMRVIDDVAAVKTGATSEKCRARRNDARRRSVGNEG